MITAVLLVSIVTLAAATALYACFREWTEENASGPRSEREPLQGLLKAVADRFIALGRASDEVFRVARNAASRLRQDIVVSAHWVNARLILRRAEAKAQSAQEAAIEQCLPEAEALLDQALNLLESACEQLGDAQDYDLIIDHVRRSCRDTAVCLRAHAAFTVKKMDRLLARNEPPVISFETDAASDQPRRKAA